MPGPPQAGPAARPLLLLVAGTSSASSSCERISSTTSASRPVPAQELEARLAHLFWRTGRGTRPELIEYGPLVLNLETYQAASPAGRST